MSTAEAAPAPIPQDDLGIQHRQIAAEVAAGWARVAAEGSFVLGPDVEAFEREFARFSGVAHGVGVANGTDAVELALRARGVGPGDEVIVPVNAFNAIGASVVRSGARPVMVDCDPRYLLVDAEAVIERIGPRTRAVLAVHQFGQMAPVEVIARECPSDVDVVEVGSNSPGATRLGRPSGSVGTIAAVSLHPRSNLGAYGDAGVVLTNERWMADLVRALRNHGGTGRSEHDYIGMDSRLDTLQAVVLRAKLRRLASWNEERRTAARRYHQLLVDEPAIKRPATMPGNEHVWRHYAIRLAGRDRVLNRLNRVGVGVAVHYPVPLHLQPAFAGLGYVAGDFPVAEAAARSLLSLPLYPGISEGQQQRVVSELVAAIQGVDAA